MATRKVLYMGLGEMGYRIAGRLPGAFAVKVWNRTNSKAEQHAREFNTQAVLGPNPFEEDQSDVDFFMSCLPTSVEVGTYVDYLMNSRHPIKPGAVWIDNTSGVPAASQELAAKLQAREVEFIDAPVSGGRKGAASGTLTVMVGGPRPAFEKAADVFQAIGKNIAHIDDKPGAGHAVKGINNLLYGCNLIMAMKAAQAVEKYGMNPDLALRAIQTSSGGSNSMNRVIEYVLNNRSIDYSFKAHALIKDMEIGLSLVDRQGNQDPVVESFEVIMNTYRRMAEGSDWANAEVFDAFEFIERR